MVKIDCNNMNELYVCKLDGCTCGYTEGKCEDMVCEDYSSRKKEYVVKMGRKLEDLILLENNLIDLKNKMECMFDIMRNIDVESMNECLDSFTEEEKNKMKNINTLINEIDKCWNATML